VPDVLSVKQFCPFFKRPRINPLVPFQTPMKSLFLLLAATFSGVTVCTTLCAQSVIYTAANPATVYNQPGSGGLPFYINNQSHWECTGNGYSVIQVNKHYALNIPSGAIIQGIRVAVDVILNNIIDSSTILLKHGVPYGADRAHHLPIISAPAITWGGNTDLWGGIWTPADLNDTSFGVQLRVRDIDAAAPFSWGDANVVQVGVYYTLPTAVEDVVAGDFRLFPDPIGGQLNLHFNLPVKDGTLHVLNALGQVTQWT